MAEGGGEVRASVRAPAVFISYASQDAAAAARLCSALLQAGVEVWFDQSELRGGDAWDQKIRQQIRDCSLFMPLISANTASRHEGYFRLEWDLADQRTHMLARNRAFIVPVCLDATEQTGTDVPESFHRVQWTRLLDGNAPATFTARIVDLLGVPSAAASAAGSSHSAAQTGPAALPAAPTPVAPAKSPRRKLFAALLAAITVMLAYFAVDWLSRHTPAEKPAAAVAPALTPAAPMIPEKSIAVLPFTDMSEKKDQEYFGDGMAEEILDLLAKAPGLKVIARTSSFQFKGKLDDLRKIAATLNVSFVVEGSVRRSGDQIRITAQLIDARSGAHRWSETYDRRFRDILALQSEIATTIARELEVATGATETALGSRFHNPDAYTVYLRGRSALDRGDRTRLSQAQHYFEQALALDPGWSRPAEALAWAYIMQVEFQFIASSEGWRQAQRAAELALRIDRSSPSAHAVLGQLSALRDFNWDVADSQFAEALRADPNNVDAMIFSANALAARGRLHEAIEREDAALTVDPLNPEAIEGRAIWLYFLRDLDGAEREIRNCLTISPTYTYAHFLLGQILLARKDGQAALRETFKETPEGGRDLGIAVINFALGKANESNEAMARVARVNGKLWPYSVAQAHAFRNERQQAFDWLDRAYDARDSDLQFLHNDPLLAHIRADARYRTLLRKMNLPE